MKRPLEEAVEEVVEDAVEEVVVPWFLSHHCCFLLVHLLKITIVMLSLIHHCCFLNLD